MKLVNKYDKKTTIESDSIVESGTGFVYEFDMDGIVCGYLFEHKFWEEEKQ